MRGSLRAARRRCAYPVLVGLTLSLAACTAAPLGAGGAGAGGTGGQTHTSTTSAAVPVTESPGDGTKDVPPAAPVSVSAKGSTLHDVALTSPTGTKVNGTLSPAGGSWAASEALGYGSTYT